MKKSSIRHVSREMKNKQCRWKSPPEQLPVDSIDIAETVKCLTKHITEPRSGHVIEFKRLGRYLMKNKKMHVDLPTTSVGSVVASACGFRLGRRLAWKKEHDGLIVRRGKTLAETHVVFANACCFIKRRS